MTYEHKSSVKNNNVPKPLKVAGVISAVILLIYIVFPNLISGLVTTLVSPFWNLEKKVLVSDQNIPLELQNSMINELIKENRELKTMLHKTATSSTPYLSYILKKPPFTAYDSYIIDTSNYKNISIGDKVYAIPHILLGEVVEKNGSYAKVKLYSSYGEKFDVVIGRNNIQATAHGLGGGTFEVILPKDIKVYEGDSVVIPDLEVSIFAIVKRVTVDPARAFSTILFSQPVNIYEQKWVIVYK